MIIRTPKSSVDRAKRIAEPPEKTRNENLESRISDSESRITNPESRIPSPSRSSVSGPSSPKTLIQFRPYQREIFADRATGIVVLHWSRQIGKSFTLAAWAVDRLLTRPGRLVTVLSNSRDNGAEFVQKVHEVLVLLGQAYEAENNQAELDGRADLSEDAKYEAMRFEVRVTFGGKTGRIKVLAANPRTARGFSGDLILDEFGFHEDSTAIWEAAEPILSSNPDFLCRISSTGNGKQNMFYRMATNGQFKVSRVPRSLAVTMGVTIYDPNTRQSITPEQARAQSLDKRAYDQNYECSFNDENGALLTHELVSAAERDDVGVICHQDWSAEAMALLKEARGDLHFGFDVGRSHDLSVLTVIERVGTEKLVRAILRMENMRLPDQQRRLGELFLLPQLRGGAIDMTGIGLGLTEYSQEQFGKHRIQGVNFSSFVPITDEIAAEGRKTPTVRITEAMAVAMLRCYEDRSIKHPRDCALRDDLRKPERVVLPGGSVRVAAARDARDHADHFWSFALAIRAGRHGRCCMLIIVPDGRRERVLEARHEREVLA